jgi:hypothetical protein
VSKYIICQRDSSCILGLIKQKIYRIFLTINYYISSGDIIIERLNKSNVFVKSCESLNSSANNNNILLEYQKPVKLFDMKKFRCDVVQELNNSSYPDRKILERKCVSCVSFVQDSPQLLQTPIWCLVINILALDLLKSKLPIRKT